MGIGDTIMLTACLAGFMVAMPALFIFLNLALLGTSDKATARLNRGGCIPFFAGLAAIVACGAPAAILISFGSIFQAVGSIIILALLFFGFMGLSVVSRLVGQRLVAMYDTDGSPLVQTISGAIILSFSIAFPLLGWFIILPFSLITGFGAVLLVFVSTFLNSRLFAKQPQPIEQHPPQMPVYDGYGSMD